MRCVVSFALAILAGLLAAGAVFESTPLWIAVGCATLFGAFLLPPDHEATRVSETSDSVAESGGASRVILRADGRYARPFDFDAKSARSTGEDQRSVESVGLRRSSRVEGQ